MGLLEHDPGERGSNLALSEELAWFGGPRGSHDQRPQAAPARSEEGHDVVADGAVDRRSFTDLRVGVLHIRNPTLATHLPLHHHFRSLGVLGH